MGYLRYINILNNHYFYKLVFTDNA